MELAVVLTQEESVLAEVGDAQTVNKIRQLAKDSNVTTVLGKGEDAELYDVSEVLLPGYPITDTPK